VTAATDRIKAEPSREVVRLHEDRVKARPWALALGVSLWAALIAGIGIHIGGQWDAWQLWHGARALLADQDPYAAVAASDFPWPLYYPLPAVLLMAPFAGMPETVARILWAMATGALFAYGLRARGPALVGAVSALFLAAILLGHVVPAMMAAAFVPWLGFLWVAKPSLGLALFLAYPSRRAAIGCAAFLFVSVAVMPDWPLRWVEALGANDRLPPVLQPFGLVLLLAWWRWDTPGGRLLGSLAFIPHGVYDALALLLVARTVKEGLGLAVLSIAGVLLTVWLVPWAPGGDLSDPARFLISLGTLYLPALVLVLSRPRPATSGRGYWSPGWGTTRRAAPAST
jgi:hypothetical protein